MTSPHHPVVARLYDVVMMPSERRALGRQRERLVGSINGRILEIGVGTGQTLTHYRADADVDVVDWDRHMLKQASKKAREAIAHVTIHEHDAKDLPFDSATFDFAVTSLALCTIDDPRQALREIRRVLTKSGQLRFLEHVRSPSRFWGAVEDSISPLWRRIAGGCRINQDTTSVLAEGGFDIVRIWTSRGGGLIQGEAVPRRDLVD